MNLIQTEH